jgi:hypothetical protein
MLKVELIAVCLVRKGLGLAFLVEKNGFKPLINECV